MSEHETTLTEDEIRNETTEMGGEEAEEGDSDGTDSGGDSDGMDSGDDSDSDGSDSDSDGSDS
jgi:hypothetical protein